MKTITVSEARKLFARILESVVKNDTPVVIVRYRDPIAAIVPFSRLSAAERSAAEGAARPSRHKSRRPD